MLKTSDRYWHCGLKTRFKWKYKAYNTFLVPKMRHLIFQFIYLRAVGNGVDIFDPGWGKNGERYHYPYFMINCLEYWSINSTGFKLSLNSHIKFLDMHNGVPLIMKHPV